MFAVMMHAITAQNVNAFAQQRNYFRFCRDIIVIVNFQLHLFGDHGATTLQTVVGVELIEFLQRGDVTTGVT